MIGFDDVLIDLLEITSISIGRSLTGETALDTHSTFISRTPRPAQPCTASSRAPSHTIQTEQLPLYLKTSPRCAQCLPGASSHQILSKTKTKNCKHDIGQQTFQSAHSGETNASKRRHRLRHQRRRMTWKRPLFQNHPPTRDTLWEKRKNKQSECNIVRPHRTRRDACEHKVVGKNNTASARSFQQDIRIRTTCKKQCKMLQPVEEKQYIPAKASSKQSKPSAACWFFVLAMASSIQQWRRIKGTEKEGENAKSSGQGIQQNSSLRQRNDSRTKEKYCNRSIKQTISCKAKEETTLYDNYLRLLERSFQESTKQQGWFIELLSSNTTI